jgi:hypothetical protein
MLVALLARAERPGSSTLERERAAVLRSAAMWRPQAEYQRALEVVEVEYDETLNGLRSKLIELHWVPSTAPAIPRRHASAIGECWEQASSEAAGHVKELALLLGWTMPVTPPAPPPLPPPPAMAAADFGDWLLSDAELAKMEY